MAVPHLFDPTKNSALANPAPYDMLVASYAPEIQGAYMYNTFVSRMLSQKIIPDGHVEARFKKYGRIGSAKHNRGDSFYGFDSQQTYRSIFLDDRPQWSGEEQEDLLAMLENDPQLRTLTLTKIADALSSWTEVEAMKMVWEAALTPAQANVDASQFYGAYDWTAGNFEQTNGATIRSNLPVVTEDAAGAQNAIARWDDFVVALEDNGIPAQGFNLVTTPKLWQEIFKLDQVDTSGTANPTAGNVSIFADSRINSNPLSISEYYGYETPLRYNGLNIWKHNHFKGSSRSTTGFARDHSAAGNPQAETGGTNRNSATAADVTGLLFHGEAVGFVQKMGPVTKVENPDRTDNELIRSKVWIGGGTVMPELATAFVSA